MTRKRNSLLPRLRLSLAIACPRVLHSVFAEVEQKLVHG